MEKRKNASWRTILRCISMGFILYMYGKKDILPNVLSLYSTMSKERVIPLMIITIGVSLVKIVVITGAVLLVKWVVRKGKEK